MCCIVRTRKCQSGENDIGNYDSVLLNDSFSTSDSVYALWGTSVLHDRTPPRLKYNRAEILLYSQVVEPVAGYHGMSRLTVTYQMKNQNLGVLEYVYLCQSLTSFTQSNTTNRYLNYKQSVSNLIMKPGLRKGVKQFKELQEFLKRPSVQAHMDRLQRDHPQHFLLVYERHKERRERSVESSQRIRTLSSARSPLKPAVYVVFEPESLISIFENHSNTI